MAAMPSAMEQQRRSATRRSCTGIGRKGDAGPVAFFEDALHPESEAGFLFSGRGHGQRGHRFQLAAISFSVRKRHGYLSS